MGLISDLKSNDKKGLFNSNDTVINYSTGLLPLDYANGYWQEIHKPDGSVEHEAVLGIRGGSFISIIAPSGCGKAQPDNTMIPVPAGGFKQLGDIQIGDEVFDGNGYRTKVLGVFHKGKRDCYSVIFEDGRSTKCCDEHLWTVCDKDGSNQRVLSLREMMLFDHIYYVPLPLHKLDYKDDGYIENQLVNKDRIRANGNLAYVYNGNLISEKSKAIKIARIEYTDTRVDMTCIYVASPTHMYITEDFIPTHNTTLADQMGYNIIKNFDDGLLYHIDAERTALRQRLIEVTGADINDERIVIKKENTSIEDVLEMITKICEAKEAGGELYKYEAPLHRYDGSSFKVYVPTVVIIDSVVSFTSKEYSVDDLGSNMDGARSAKALTRFINNCLDRMEHYNITVILISHIRQKVEINPYATTPPGIMMLKPGESVPGGMTMQYMCQNFFRISMTGSKSNAYSIEDTGFVGFKASIQVAKSKTNCVGTSIPVAFNSAHGFDPVFSLYEYANSIGLIQGKNPHLYFQGLDTMKFSRKDFIRKFMEEKEFRDEVFAILKPNLEALLGSKEVTDDDRQRYGDLFPDTNESSNTTMKKTPVKAKLK